MSEIAEENDATGAAVEFALPLEIQKYPSAKLRDENKKIGVFDAELKKLADAMFAKMYESDGVGLAAPQVGVNYRLMVYNEAGERGKGAEVVMVNPKIVKFSKEKDMFEEGCLSFPAIYADVEVRESPAGGPLALSFIFRPIDRSIDRSRPSLPVVAREKPVSAQTKQIYANPILTKMRRRDEQHPARLLVRRALPAEERTARGVPSSLLRLSPLLSRRRVSRRRSSLPHRTAPALPAQRPTAVTIEAQNVNGKKFKMTLDGFQARVFQHEYDHLDGVLFHDRMAADVVAKVRAELDDLIAAHPEGEPKAL